MSDLFKTYSLRELGKVSMCKRVLKEQTSDFNDIPFYKKRWTIEDTNDDIVYFCNKWNVLNNNGFDDVRNFIKRHSLN